jgi:hypothetical protein
LVRDRNARQETPDNAKCQPTGDQPLAVVGRSRYSQSHVSACVASHWQPPASAGAAAHADAQALGLAVHARSLDVDRWPRRRSCLRSANGDAPRRVARLWRRRVRALFALGESLATTRSAGRSDGILQRLAVLASAAASSTLPRHGVGSDASSPRPSPARATAQHRDVAAPPAVERLRRWVESVGPHGQHGWQGEFLAQAYCSRAARGDLLASGRLSVVGGAAQFYPTVKERDFFSQLERSVKGWNEEEQALFLRTTIGLWCAQGRRAIASCRRRSPGTPRRCERRCCACCTWPR